MADENTIKTFITDEELTALRNMQEPYTNITADALRRLVNTHDSLLADVEFLAPRTVGANCLTVSEKGRDTGASSNSVVAIAYGLEAKLRHGIELPGDEDDLDSCERMWGKLPYHRKTPKVIAAMGRARSYKMGKKD